MKIEHPLRDVQLKRPVGWCIRCRNELGSCDTDRMCSNCKEEEENDRKT